MTRREKILLFIGCLISILTHFRWFNGFGYLAHGDWLVQLSETAGRAFALPFIWNSAGLGGVNVHAPFYLMHIVQGGLSVLGLPFGVVERLEYLWPITILSYIGIFFLIRRVTKSDLGAFVGSFVYSLNVYFLLIQTQHLYIMLADALAPLAVLAYINALDRRRLSDMVWAGLALFIVSATDFRIFYILVLVLSTYALARAVHDGAFRHAKKLLQSGLVAGLPYVLVLLLSLYWVIGFASTTTLTSNDLLDRPIFGGAVPLASAINIHSGGWTGGAADWFASNPVPWWFWAYPIAAGIGFWVARRQRYVQFFLFISLFAIFFGKQLNVPFGDTYRWMHANFPGFNAFREASKFKFLLVMGYSVLIGYFVAWLSSRPRSSIISRGVNYAIMAVLIALPLHNTIPLLNGEIGTLFVPKQFPVDHLTFNDHLRERSDEYFRVLWLPRSESWSLSRYQPRISINDIGETELGRQAKRDSVDSGVPSTTLMTNLLTAEHGDAIMDLLSVRYVALSPLQEDDRDVFDNYYLNRTEIVARLNRADYLRRLDIDTPALTIYENQNQRPRVYHTAQPDNLENYRQNFQPIDYRQINDTEYSLSLENVSDTVYVYFSDKYHPDWTLYAGDFGWWQRFTAKSGQPVGVSLARSWSGTHEFQLDVDAFCAHYSCSDSADGSRDIDFTLYFGPQKNFYLGFLLSLVTLLACIVFLIFNHRRKRRS
ncbi:MAG: hypothetical protein V1738_05940 [Patescibacteria group bacterium]